MVEIADKSCPGRCEQGVCGGTGDWGGPCGGCCSCLGYCFKQVEREQYAQYAEDKMSCPYYLGTGKCSADWGCREEPSCKTDEPSGGWAGVLKELKEGTDHGNTETEG